jgi:hypothetical protein
VIKKLATKSITAVAAVASRLANCGPALPVRTALRKATNACTAAIIRLMAPHAACNPWMISITAAAAGTSRETSRSISI